MPNKEFIEKYPLYKKFRTNLVDYDFRSAQLGEISKPAIHMYCSTCSSEQTFNMMNEYYELESGGRPNWVAVSGKIVRARYQCSACNRFSRTFFLFFLQGQKIKGKDEDEKHHHVDVMKVGQYPAWTIELDKELENILGEHSDYYRKGLVCESQSYGIGAYAYFRRITEEIIDKLLDSINELIDDKDKKSYAEALEKAKQTRVTQEKIDLVKDLLPASLRPEGMNPLGVLHSALSEGLHSMTDEECMDQAEIIRGALVFLVNQAVRLKNESNKFTDGMKKLLEKKSK